MSAVMMEARASDTEPVSACFHCGAPLPRPLCWPVAIDGVVRSMCCPGCQAVAQAIVDNGCADYYRERTVPSGTVDQASLVPPELKLYDEPEALSEFSTPVRGGRECEAVFAVEGIRCAACAWLIEKRLARVSGVVVACMNVATERMHVRWNPECCKPSDILSAVSEVGYAAYPFDAQRHARQLERAQKTLFRQLFVAGLCMMQVMMYAVPAYLADDGTMDAGMASLMRWASLFLTLPAVLYSARPFFTGAWNALKHRALGMDMPVALGIGAGFIGSAAATWNGAGDVYFDSVTMFIFLLLCSRYFELNARRKAAASLDRLRHALPASASRMRGYPADRATETVMAAALSQGDVVLVAPGEAVPADGVILEGDTTIDAALLTGESRAQRKTVGEALPGGAVNVAQAIVMRVENLARESTLVMLVRLVERAGQGKPQLAQWADRVAAWFVGALLLLAFMVFLFWQWHDPARAWQVAVAVLVVSCPCALSLATPTALAAATDRLMEQGVVISRPHVLETLHRATHVVFDKTGTLTAGRPVLRHVEAFDGGDPAMLLKIAAALEMSNRHPVAAALVEAAGSTPHSAIDMRYIAGHGVEGSINGMRYRLGSADFVASLSGKAGNPEAPEDATSVYLGRKDKWLARFDLSDAVRADARELVDALKKAGKEVIVLSGDRQAIVEHVAHELGIVTACGDSLPDRKLAFVQDLQRKGAIVAMVGDGINDAAVLSAANVSFAMGAGAALAQVHADAVLLSDRLSSMSETVAIAEKTLRVIRQNLAWAMLYNLVAIPAAAFGWLYPWLSGAGMAASSALVVANAMRLRRAGKPSNHGLSRLSSSASV